MKQEIKKLREFILNAKSLMVLTGAGISKDSGVPTFRGEDGLWRNYDATKLATPYAFRENPKLVWEWYNWRRSIILKAAPNYAHFAIKKLEDMIEDFLLVTQNVDNLHRDAGSKKLVEMHGNIFETLCTGCGHVKFEKKVFREDELPPRCGRCNSLLRPNVVWFTEPIPSEVLKIIFESIDSKEAILVVGTSLFVYPAALLPFIFKERNKKVFEINPEETDISCFADISIRGKAKEVFEEII
ncbi:MAG: NAD-dependent deacylase [Candidatus Hydrothermales bacterium]